MDLRTVVFVGLVLAAWAAAAQEADPPATREETFRRSREEKRQSVRASQTKRIESIFRAIDKAKKPTVSAMNWKRFHPRLDWPSPGSGVAVGTRYWKRDLMGPLDVSGAAFYSIYNYQHYEVQFGLIAPERSEIPPSWKDDEFYEIGDVHPRWRRIPIYVTLRYRYLPEEDFYGLGPDSSLSNRTTYLQEETRAYLRTGVQLTRNFLWAVEGGYQYNSIGSGRSSYPSTGTVFDETTAPGLEAAPDHARFATLAFLDFRERRNPERGVTLAVMAARFLGSGSGAFSFDRYGFDVRTYAPLGSPQRILALRAAGNSDHPHHGAQVPFFLQESLGGSHTLRGFDTFRFRGEKVLLFQGEYRWEPAAYWQIAAFIDAGTLGRVGSSPGSFHWDWGLGTQFKIYSEILLRLEVAFSSETTRYYIRGSQSF
jgi:hypothetical protein